LFATIDSKSKKVIDVTDTGVVPVSEKDWGYTAGETASYAGTRQRVNPGRADANRRWERRDSRQPDSVGHLAISLAR